MMRKSLLGVFAFFISFTPFAQAKLIHFGSSLETVRVSYGGPTIFRFPSEVRTISQASLFDIKPANAEDPDYSVLSVTPRFTKGSSQVVFILSNGGTVRVKIIIAEMGSANAHAIYDFQDQENLLAEGMKQPNGPSISATDLMKAMIRDDFVSGYKYRKLSSTKSRMGQIVVSLIRIYEGDQFNGYVFTAKNIHKKKSYKIDVRRLFVGRPNLAVLSQVDNPVLKPGKSEGSETVIRIVTKATALYSDVVLPVSVHSDKGAQ